MVVLAVLGGCVHHAARQTTAGAMTSVERRLQELSPTVPGPLAERSARGAVTGVLSELSSPEQQARFDSVVTAASTAVIRGIGVGLRGTDGVALRQVADRAAAGAVDRLAYVVEYDPALRGSLATITRELSASAVIGAREELESWFPTCAEAGHAACIERHVTSLARAAARGAVAGMVEAARLPLVGLAFLAGILVAFLWSRVRGHRELDHPARGA